MGWSGESSLGTCLNGVCVCVCGVCVCVCVCVCMWCVCVGGGGGGGTVCVYGTLYQQCTKVCNCTVLYCIVLYFTLHLHHQNNFLMKSTKVQTH